MKRYDYKEILVTSTPYILDIMKKPECEGWEICGMITDDEKLIHVIIRKEWCNDISIGLLKSCAYMRGVPELQHRTIAEFAQFVEDVMRSKGEGEYGKYQFEWNSTDAIEMWIEKFHEYYRELERERTKNYESEHPDD